VRGAVWLLMLLSAPAYADPARIALDAPPGCPDRAAFLQLVAQHADGATVELSAQVRVERTGPRWIATVDLPGADGRRLEGATCAEVMDAAALVLAFAVDIAEPDAVAPPEPPRPLEPSPLRIARPAPAPPPVVDVRVRAGAVGDAGSLPGAAVAAAASAAVWRGALGVELSTALFRPSEASVDAGRVAPIGLWTVGLRGCRRLGFAAGCLGGEAGRMSADAGGLDAGMKTSALWSALSASAWLRRRVAEPAAVYAGAELLATLRRPRFVLDDDTDLHRPARFAARLLAGVELDLW